MAEPALDFIANSLKRLMHDVADIKDHLTVQTGMIQALQGSVDGLKTEVSGTYRIINRINERLRLLEDRMLGNLAPPDEPAR